MAHWKQHQEANANLVAQHRSRYGQVLPPSHETDPGVYGPPDSEAPVLYGGAAALLGLAIGVMLWPLWVAIGFGFAVGVVFWGLLWLARRGIRRREVREAAVARAIREAETERQMAEFKASGGWKGSKAP